jgi:molecular chaperone GrpE
MALPEEEAKSPEDTEDGQAHSDVAEVKETMTDEGPEDDQAPAESQSPEEALQMALEDVSHFKDLAMRAEAEMQNMQRRTARDVEHAHKFGLERFLQNLIPVVDSLEKAIEASEQAKTDTSDAIAEGVSLCYKLLIDVLGKENVEIIDPAGEPFDPNEHQAMSMVENPDMEPNSVFAVVQKGYKLNGRLVRAAMVMVTKAPATNSEDTKAES